MSDVLPESWVTTKLSDILEIHYGKGLTKKKRDPNGPVDVYGSSGTVGKHSQSLIKERCIIIGRKGAVGSVYYTKGPSWPIDTVYYSIPPNEIHSKYLFYNLYSQNLKKLDTSTAIPSLRRDDLYEVRVNIPPYNEQVRIVSKIEELLTRLDQGIIALQQTQQQLEQYQRSTLKQAFTGKLSQKWRENNPDIEDSQILLNRIQNDMNSLPNQRYKPSELDTDHLPEIPDKWSWVNLGKAFYTILGQSPPSSTYNENEEGLPFFQGSKEFQDYYPRIEKWCSKPKKIAEKEDILISVRAPVGDVNIAPIKCCIGRGLAAIRAVGDVDKMFVFYLIKYIQRDLDSKGTGTTFRAVTGDVLRNYPVPLPPLKETLYIASKLDQINTITQSIMKNVRTSINQLSILKQTILKRAFSGGLVPQDASDEYASVILKRIMAEKAKVMPIRRRGRRRKGQGDLNFNMTPVRRGDTKRMGKELL